MHNKTIISSHFVTNQVCASQRRFNHSLFLPSSTGIVCVGSSKRVILFPAARRAHPVALKTEGCHPDVQRTMVHLLVTTDGALLLAVGLFQSAHSHSSANVNQLGKSPRDFTHVLFFLSHIQLFHMSSLKIMACMKFMSFVKTLIQQTIYQCSSQSTNTQSFSYSELSVTFLSGRCVY